jgi:type VI secretion system secreted protein VgrG
MAIDQTKLNFRLETPLGADKLVVSRFEASEGISQLYECRLELISEELAVDFKAILGKAALLTIALPGGSTRHLHGIVTRFAQLPPEGSYARYEADLRPSLWVLAQRRNCRIFQEQTVPAIVQTLLGEASIKAIDDKIQGKHPQRGYCVQYQESDFDFASRLMEEEGIFYYFRHSPKEGHVLVLADGTDFVACPGVDEAAYNAGQEQAVGKETLHRFQREQRLLTARYVVDDFNFVDPKTDLTAEATASLPQTLPPGTFEHFDYPTGQVKQGAETEGKMAFGEDLALLRADAARAAAFGFAGESDIGGLLAGHKLKIANCPRPDFDGEYLLTAVETVGDQSESLGESGGGGGGAAHLGNRFSCLPLKEVPVFRPAARTPRPRMPGPQTALVVGPSGEEIHTDPYGRVKVQFHWDRYSKADDKSSCWLRVSQSWAGNLWGAFVLPRIGMEVVVDFLDGDPDRPLVTGAVYNAVTMPPYALPDKATQSVFKSQSSKGGGGTNEIRLEDKKDAEQIFINAQKDFDFQVGHDSRMQVGNDQHATIKNDRFEQVDNNAHETIGADLREKVGKDHHLAVTGKQAMAIGEGVSQEIGADRDEKVGGNQSLKVGGNLLIDGGGDIVIEAATSLTLVCGSSSCVIDATGVTLKGSILTLDGSKTNINSGPGSSPASLSPGSLVAPTAPDPPVAPEAATSGENVKPPAHKPPKTEEVVQQGGEEKKEPEPPDWIELEMVNEDGEPAAGERYTIELPDGSVAEGTLDQKGYARVEGVKPGNCKVSFPNLDKKNWEKGS